MQVLKGGQNQVSGSVSIPCWHTAPTAIANGSLSNSVKIKLCIKVIKRANSLIGLEVTVTGRSSECDLPFARGTIHILNKIPVSNIKLP